MANWNAEPVAVSPSLLGNISVHPVPTRFSLGMDKCSSKKYLSLQTCLEAFRDSILTAYKRKTHKNVPERQ